MRNIKIIVILLLIIFNINSDLIAQKKFGSEEASYTFAFKINTTADGQTVKCAIINTGVAGGRKIKYIPVRLWVRQFLGYDKSNANPECENFAKKYDVFKVPDEVIEMGKEEIEIYSIARTESILRNLWRLRYREYPFFPIPQNVGKGWAAHPDSNVCCVPSNEQFLILENYGIKRMNDFFKGEKAFRLLRDMLDKSWQARYAGNAQSLE